MPAKWSYISDGRYAEFSFGNITIEFKRRNNAEISKMTTLSAMIIQAIKTIGKDKITDEEIQYLQKKLTDKEKEELLASGKTTSIWVYQILRKICEME